MESAAAMDAYGNKAAKDKISAIKIVAPRMAKRVIDRAMQTHGALGLSQDSVLPHFWTAARALQLADGPDEVHIAALGKSVLKNR